MAYNKTNWVDGTTEITATLMNKIEQGIEDAHNQSVVQTAGGTATAITLTGVNFVDGFAVSFIVAANNGGTTTTINGKPLYKPATTSAPVLKAGKKANVWYNATGDCFFFDASAEGTATVSQVLAGATFSNDDDTGLVGTLPNLAGQVRNHSSSYIASVTQSGVNGVVSFNPYSGYSGYYDNTSTLGIYLDNLSAGNIKAGVKIGDSDSPSSVDYITGTFTADATATAGDMLSGESAYVNGSKVTGTIPSKTAQTFTPSTVNQTISSGQYLSGVQTISGSANLVAGNIKKGVNIFGVVGSLPYLNLENVQSGAYYVPMLSTSIGTVGTGMEGSSTYTLKRSWVAPFSGTVNVIGYGSKDTSGTFRLQMRKSDGTVLFTVTQSTIVSGNIVNQSNVSVVKGETYSFWTYWTASGSGFYISLAMRTEYYPQIVT